MSESTMSPVAGADRRLACGVTSMSLVVLAAVSSSSAAAQELYFAEGYTISHPSGGSGAPTFAALNQDVLEAVLCPEPGVHIAPGEKLWTLASMAAQATGVSFSTETFEAFRDFANETCEPDPAVERRAFNIVYATCRMTMRAESQTVDMRFPPGQTEGVMELIDHENRTALVSQVAFTQVLGEQDGLLSLGSEGEGDNVTRQQNNPEFDAVLSESVYPVTYEFSFTLDFLANAVAASGAAGGSGGAGLAGMMSALSPKIATRGLAWAAPDAPGVDVVRGFYEQFAAALRSGSSTTQSLLGGLFNHQILGEGIPVLLSEITEIESGFGVQERSFTSTRILRHYTRDEPEGYCEGSYIPSDYTISDPVSDAASSGAFGQAGSAAGAGAASEGMSGLAEAMRGLSDEQRTALEGFGMGGLFGGGGAGGQGQTGQAAAPAAAAGGRPSSADLSSDDLTQTVQRYLEALGYDPGNTDGEPALQTTIAISQFQAESGLEVTGEVTPQLVGILAAGVDARR
jgi:hypothetical protein